MPQRESSTKAEDLPIVEGFPLTFDSKSGRMFVQGMPVWFMSPFSYVEMQAQLEDLMGKAAKGVLYRAAEQAGRRFAETLGAANTAEGDDGTHLAVLLRLAEFLRHVGHGYAELVIVDIGRIETTWTMPQNYISELHAPTNEPVCHFYSGAIAGAVSAVFGRSVACDEVKCRAKGDPACEFRTRAA